MGNIARRWGVRSLVVLVLSAAAQGARADNIETRHFAIQVDGKPAGQYTMTITQRDGGAESMAGQASVRVKHLLGSYSYSYQGTEQWHKGRLQQLQSTTNDDGKRYDVQAVAEGDTLRVRANGHERTTRGDAWPTTHWKLLPSEYHNKAVTLLDADTGKEIIGHLNYVGVQQLTLGGQPQNCYHFRVTGGPSPVDLWYDGAYRLVRQEFTVDGHRTAFYLTSLRKQ